MLGLLVLKAQRVQLKYCLLATFCDKMTTIMWSNKLQNSKSAIAGYLICFLGLWMHQGKCSIINPHHIAGKDNIMADIISCAFKMGKLFAASNDIVSSFNTHFPLMQNKAWHECQVTSDLLS